MDWLPGPDTGAFGNFAETHRCETCQVPPGAWHLDWCDEEGEWDGIRRPDGDGEPGRPHQT